MQPLDVLLFLRHIPDRLLHPVRRARITAAIRERGPLRSILFLCHGNVCRSPFAAASFEREAQRRGGQVVVRSAGFIGPHRAPPDEAQQAAARRGIDLASHRSALVTPQDIDGSDITVVMSSAQARTVQARFPHALTTVVVLGDLDPQPIAKRTILDPWNGDAAAFEESYDRIVRCMDVLTTLSMPIAQDAAVPRE